MFTSARLRFSLIEFRLEKFINRALTNNSILFEAMQQAGGELLDVLGETGTVFDLPYQLDQHVGRHWQTIIALEKLSSSVALL